MPSLNIGTCSWRYPDWHGLVYSAPKGINYLKEYSNKYNTVEIDHWFWSLFSTDSPKLPKLSEVIKYRDAVPPDFKFTVKVPNAITLTHFYNRGRKGPPEPNPYFLSTELFEKFISVLKPIHGKLSSLIFQFEYLNKQKMANMFQFLERLGGFLSRICYVCPISIEIRNKNFFSRPYFDFLLSNGLSPVLIEGYWMPHIWEVYNQWHVPIIQAPHVVIRLIGPDRKGIEQKSGKKWNRVVDPRDDDLGKISWTVNALLSNGVDVFVNVNNHYEGCAPMTIERILRNCQ